MTNIADTHEMAKQHGHLNSGRARASISGAVWSGLNTVITTVATAALFYVSSRYLGPREFGLIAITTSIVTIASALAPAAFGEALVQRREIFKRHIDTVFWLCLSVAITLYFLLLVLADPLADWLEEPIVAVLLPLIGIRLGFEMLAVAPTALIIRSMRFRAIALRTGLANLAAATVCITLLLKGFGLWALAFAQVANVAVSAIVVVVASGWRPGFNISRSALSDLASYGVFASGTRALTILRIDQLLIGAIGGPALAGLFNFANRLFQMLSGLISGAFGAVSHSLFSSLQSDINKVRDAFLIVLFGSCLVAFPIFSGLFLVTDTAIPLIFGNQWNGAIIPVKAFSVIGLIAAISVVQGSLLTSQGWTAWWFWYQLVVQVANLPLIVFLIPKGLDAVLIGIALKTLVLWPISVALSMRLLGLGVTHYANVLTVPIIATAIMATLVIWLPSLTPSLNKGAVLTLQVTTGALCYVLVAVLLGRAQLTEISKHLRSRKESV